MTVDPFLLRGAAVGAAWRADRGGAAGAVYHAVGGGPLPIASGLPRRGHAARSRAVGAARTRSGGPSASRFGQRLRAQILRDAAAVIVGSEATARAARRLLRVRRDRLRVVRLAPRPAFAAPRARPTASPPAAGLRERLGLPGRATSCCSGRFDARLDLATTARRARAPWPRRRRRPALGRGVAAGRRGCCWSARARRIGRPSPGPRLARGVGEALAYAPALAVDGPRRRSSAAPGPCSCRCVSEAAGLPAIEALAAGTPVVASAVGPLPELVGAAGLLVEPRDADRLAVALGHDLGRRRASTPRSPRPPRAGRDGPPDLGRRGARDAGGLRRGRRSGARRSRSRARSERPLAAAGQPGVAEGTGVAGGWSEPALNDSG